jgi:hypothetical protein
MVARRPRSSLASSATCRPAATCARIRCPHGLPTRRERSRWGQGVPLTRRARRLPRILTPAEVDALTAALRTHRDRAMVAATVLGGLPAPGDTGGVRPGARAGPGGPVRGRLDHQIPWRRRVSGRSPVDRGKRGTKRSVVTDAFGIPLHVVAAPASAHDAPCSSRPWPVCPTRSGRCPRGRACTGRRDTTRARPAACCRSWATPTASPERAPPHRSRSANAGSSNAPTRG